MEKGEYQQIPGADSDDPKSGFNHDAKPAATAASANGFGSPGGDDPKKDDEMSWVSRQAKKAFTKKQLYRKVPIIDWLPKYNLEKAVSDTIAGITVALTVIPQGIAYALVAGLPPEYGLYSAFMGGFVYAIFGSCKDITVGPTAIMSLMTAEYARKHGEEFTRPELAVLLAFITGIVVFTFGILKLGFLIEFISVPVIAGFTSAAAITIASGQIKGVFGLTIHKEENATEVPGIVGTYIEVVENFHTIRWQDTVLALTCIVVLLLMRELKNVTWFIEIDPESGATPTSIQSSMARKPALRKFCAKTVWLLSIGRNAVITLICLLIAYLCDPDVQEGDETTFKLTGNITSGMPPFSVPPFSINIEGVTEDFMYMIERLGTAIIIIPIIAILEDVAIAKAFAGGKPVDASQEMIALGFCNLAGSFFSSMPTTGSFSRTAVNSASGVRTTAGGIITGGIVILTLLVLMPVCFYIPKATLAAVIITAVIFSVEYEYIMPMFRAKKSDLFCAFVTFCCCLFWALEWGILVGVGVHIIFVMWDTARPKLDVQREHLSGQPGTTYIVIRIDRSFVFPSVSYVRNIVNKVAVRQGESTVPVVFDCSRIYTSDFTAALGSKSMAADFKKRGQQIFFLDLNKSVQECYDGAGHGEVVAVEGRDELRAKLEEFFANRDNVGAVAAGGDAPTLAVPAPSSTCSSSSGSSSPVVPAEKTSEPLLDNQAAMGQTESCSKTEDNKDQAA